MKIVIGAFDSLNIPQSVKEIDRCPATGATLIYMTQTEFNTFLQSNNYITAHQDTQELGTIRYVMNGPNVVAQYWNNENERQIWMNDNKDAW